MRKNIMASLLFCCCIFSLKLICSDGSSCLYHIVRTSDYFSEDVLHVLLCDGDTSNGMLPTYMTPARANEIADRRGYVKHMTSGPNAISCLLNAKTRCLMLSGYAMVQVKELDQSEEFTYWFDDIRSLDSALERVRLVGEVGEAYE
ncbi:hypothetical protein HN446_02915 [bacterium]|nr:hypothetical protein [bacterium]